MLLLSVFIVFTSAEEITCLWVVDPKGNRSQWKGFESRKSSATGVPPPSRHNR